MIANEFIGILKEKGFDGRSNYRSNLTQDKEFEKLKIGLRYAA